MIPTGIFLISNLKSYNIPAVVQHKGTVRRLDLFSRVFLNEAARQEEGHRPLNANTLTLCDYVLRPTSKRSSGWEKPKLKTEKSRSPRPRFLSCLLENWICTRWPVRPVISKLGRGGGGHSGNALMKGNPRGNRQKSSLWKRDSNCRNKTNDFA